MEHHVLRPAIPPPTDGPFLDFLGFVPDKAQQPESTCDRALQEQVKSQAFEPGGELVAGPTGSTS